jgi:hypothetical protein
MILASLALHAALTMNRTTTFLADVVCGELRSAQERAGWMRATDRFLKEVTYGF